jgi:hypothetical protein
MKQQMDGCKPPVWATKEHLCGNITVHEAPAAGMASI